MPWELGYFDGYKPGFVAILPLVQSSGSDFKGQEYLGFYPYIEDIEWDTGRRGFGMSRDLHTAWPLRRLVASGGAGLRGLRRYMGTSEA